MYKVLAAKKLWACTGPENNEHKEYNLHSLFGVEMLTFLVFVACGLIHYMNYSVVACLTAVVFPFLLMPSHEPFSLNSLPFFFFLPSSLFTILLFFFSNYKIMRKHAIILLVYLFVLFCFINMSLAGGLEMQSLTIFGISLTESRHA